MYRHMCMTVNVCFYKGTEMCTVFAIEMLGVIVRQGGRLDGTPPGSLDFQRARLMNSQCCNVRTAH